MAMVKLTLKSSQDGVETAEYVVQEGGKPLVIEAVNGTEYQLVADDDSTVVTARQMGDDLYLFEGNASEASLIVTSYFNADAGQVSLNNGQGVYQLVEIMPEAAPEALLASEVSGGTSAKSAGLIAGGLGLLAAVAAAGGGGGGGHSSTTEASAVVETMPPVPATPVPVEADKEGITIPATPQQVPTVPAAEVPAVPVAESPAAEKTPVPPVQEEVKSETPAQPAVPVTEPPAAEKTPVPSVQEEVKNETPVTPAQPVTEPPVVNTPVTPVVKPSPDTGAQQPVAAGGKESGLTLDIAKHFYSVEVIKDFIDTISNAGGTFLQLHFSDDANYALESTVLNQRVADAVRGDDGSYTNPVTGKSFLSYAQLSDIVAYAQKKGVELIPEVDTPNHMDAIFTLLEHSKGADYVQSLKSKVVDDEIDITNKISLDFVKSLYSEVIGIFGASSKHFHIGGDEFGYSVGNNHEFISYVNELSEFLASHGLTTRMWNDGLIKSNLAELNHDVQITYWSYDGNPGDTSVAAQRRAIRASMPDLLEEGFQVLNYNSYYLYSVPEEGAGTSQSGDFAARDTLLNWDLGVWDNNNHSNVIVDTSNIIGAALSIWGEHAGSLNDSTIQKYTAGHLAAIIKQTNAEADSSGAALAELKSVSDNAFSSLVQEVYMDFEQIQDNETVDLLGNGSQILNLLQEEILSSRHDLDVWVLGTKSDTVVLDADNWVKSGETSAKGSDVYMAYVHNGNKLWIDSDIIIETV